MNGYIAREELLSRARTLTILPTLSTVIDKVFRILNDRNASFDQLHGVIQYDQAISSKIISISNSAYYSRGIKIVTLQRAMIVIGFDEIKNIVTCLLFLDGILRKLKLKDHDLLILWEHSLRVACSAKVLSSRTGVEDPEKVFTIALLHDIGKILLCMYDEEYRLAMEKARSGATLPLFEKNRYRTDHQELGYYMSIKWRFPDEFTTVIRYHHQPERPAECEALLGLVSSADEFVHDPERRVGKEAAILSKERDRIENEVQKIMQLMG